MYNVAIVGAGVWSQNHLTGWRAQRDVKVTWLVRSTEEKAREKAEAWGVPNWSADYRQVIARNDVDIVDIVLPHDLHADVACAALAHGKHVVMEKPVATTLADAQRIADAAKQYQRNVMVSENWNYSTWVRKAQGLIEQGAIGTPFLIRCVLDMDVRDGFVGLDWRYRQDRMGGGALLDGGTHPVSACRYLLGEITEVCALLGNYGFAHLAPMEDTCLLLMRFASGASGTLASSWIAQRERPHSEFVILGDKGTIEFDTHARQFFLTKEQRRTEEFCLQPSRGFVEQMQHFIECLRTGQAPLTSPEEQMGSLRAILAAYKSMKSGRMERVAETVA
jgi:predicted dehydrogenase